MRHMGKKYRKQRGKTKFFRKKKLLFLFLMLVATAVGILLFQYRTKEKNEAERYKKLQEEKRSKGIQELQKKYLDMVGWLEIRDTEFSYPVMQTKNDPEYYLHRDERGNYSFYGTPFLDARCTMESDNLIVYGHNINGRRFFGYLQNYRDSSFYLKHKELYLKKRNGSVGIYPIVSVIETDIYSDYYKCADVYNDETYRHLAREMLENSLYHCEMADILEKEMNENTVEAFFHQYQFLTLSTCRTGEGRDSRLLVVGCKRRQDLE